MPCRYNTVSLKIYSGFLDIVSNIVLIHMYSCMYNVIVPKKDLGYVQGIIKRYYRGWINASLTPDRNVYNIEVRIGSNEGYLEAQDYVVEFSKKRLSSLPVHEVLKIIEHGRARLRQTISWDQRGFYRLDQRGVNVYGHTINPGYDLFLLLGDTWTKILSDLGFKDPPKNTIMARKFRGVHDIYSGDGIIARLFVKNYGKPVLKILNNRSIENDLDKYVLFNSKYIDRHVEIVSRFLSKLDSPDLVVISFSGGKDSIVLLDLALRLYGRSKVIPVYVDTGMEFPFTLNYISIVEQYYGIEIVKVYAGIDRVVSVKGLPTRENRWCTGFKRRAFYRKLLEIVKGYDNVFVLLGDRDAESRSRSHRPPVRRRNTYLEISPLKQWGTIHIQTYILSRRLPINPLYMYGFYRTGCYICPLLRDLEKYIMRKYLWNILKGIKYIDEFMR